MNKQEVTVRLVFLVAIFVIYSIPYDLATYYVLTNSHSNPIWDSNEMIPTIILGLSQRQQVLLDLFQKLLIPIVVVLSVLWLPDATNASAPARASSLVGLRYFLGAVCLLLFVTIVADYVVVDGLSNYAENNLTDQKNAILAYLSGGIENSITILALLIGINMKG